MSDFETEPRLSAKGQKALRDLQLTLEAKNVLDEERQGYIDKLMSRIAGVQDSDIIDETLGNILLEITKKARERKMSGE